MSLDEPVIFLVFNRPRLTKRVFEVIRAAGPKQLFVVADGPRDDRDGALCAEVRRIVAGVDWACRTEHLFCDENMGCRERVSSGIADVLRMVDRAIVLEDDCLPHPSFFPFCAELLKRLQDCPEVYSIGGAALIPWRRSEQFSYRYSRYPLVWGWATWRRAWAHYRHNLDGLEEYVAGDSFMQHCPCPAERHYWTDVWKRTQAGQVNSWAYSWVYSCWHDGALNVLPSGNLVSNIGFSGEATHTKPTIRSPFAELPVVPLGEISHPLAVKMDREYDRTLWTTAFDPSLQGRLLRWGLRLRRFLDF